LVKFQGVGKGHSDHIAQKEIQRKKINLQLILLATYFLNTVKFYSSVSNQISYQYCPKGIIFQIYLDYDGYRDNIGRNEHTQSQQLWVTRDIW